MVEMFDDRIEISNPGGLPKGLTPEEFGTKSVLRNPVIASLLHRIGYIEKMGTGINKMKRLIAKAGLSPLEFRFTTFFTIIFTKPNLDQKREITILETEKFGVKFGVKGSRLNRILNILFILNQGYPFSIDNFARTNRISRRVIEKDISFLKNKGIIEFQGAPKTGKYLLTEQGKKVIEEMSL